LRNPSDGSCASANTQPNDSAARLGQANELATFLDQNVPLYDIPIRFVWITHESHRPTALRVERLREHLKGARPVNCELTIAAQAA
jgi:hypothetical protein